MGSLKKEVRNKLTRLWRYKKSEESLKRIRKIQKKKKVEFSSLSNR
jgi:RPA family protein